MSEPSRPVSTEKLSVGVTGRLAPRPWREGDPLPEVGTQCLVAGANTDVESDQHRAFSWCRVVGYTADNQFACFQVANCWPTVERLTNCWFADEASLVKAAAPDLFAVLNELHGDFDRQTYAEMSRLEHDAPDDAEFSVNITAKQLRAINRAILKAEGKL